MATVHIDQLANKAKYMAKNENISESEALARAMEEANLMSADNANEIEAAVKERMNRNHEQEKEQAEEELQSEDRQAYNITKDEDQQLDE